MIFAIPKYLGLLSKVRKSQYYLKVVYNSIMTFVAWNKWFTLTFLRGIYVDLFTFYVELMSWQINEIVTLFFLHQFIHSSLVIKSRNTYEFSLINSYDYTTNSIQICLIKNIAIVTWTVSIKDYMIHKFYIVRT